MLKILVKNLNIFVLALNIGLFFLLLAGIGAALENEYVLIDDLRAEIESCADTVEWMLEYYGRGE